MPSALRIDRDAHLLQHRHVAVDRSLRDIQLKREFRSLPTGSRLKQQNEREQPSGDVAHVVPPITRCLNYIMEL